jgi:flagellar assembly factor FliW
MGREEETVRITTTRFGTIKVQDHAVITFPGGLIGLPHLMRFAIMEREQAGWFQWWQAVEYPETALITVDPVRVVRGYELVGIEDDLRALDLEKPSVRIVAVLVSVPGGTPEAATVNLLAPLVFNCATRQGRQIVLPDDRYAVDHRLDATTGATRPLELAA